MSFHWANGLVALRICAVAHLRGNIADKTFFSKCFLCYYFLLHSKHKALLRCTQMIAKIVVAPHETKRNDSLRGNQDETNHSQTLDAKSTHILLV